MLESLDDENARRTYQAFGNMGETAARHPGVLDALLTPVRQRYSDGTEESALEHLQDAAGFRVRRVKSEDSETLELLSVRTGLPLAW